jgi:catechol 2,3-dioxygenase-like lactoylglutathione lyase family enzyme
MLSDCESIATCAVRDIDRAARFYEETLGLTRIHSEGGQALSYRTGASTLLVYRSEFAGGNEATAVTWSVGHDLETVVENLSAKGVEFEHYDLPHTRLEGHIHVSGHLRVAWFKDPDGNIHSLVSG